MIRVQKDWNTCQFFLLLQCPFYGDPYVVVTIIENLPNGTWMTKQTGAMTLSCSTQNLKEKTIDFFPSYILWLAFGYQCCHSFLCMTNSNLEEAPNLDKKQALTFWTMMWTLVEHGWGWCGMEGLA